MAKKIENAQGILGTKKEIIAVDCETDPFRAGRIPRPFIWGAYNGEEYHKFPNAEKLLDWLTPRDALVYAHNGGKFDWHYLIRYMEENSPIMIINGRIAKFKIGNAEFRDSFNIMPMPLKAGGKKYEIEDFSIFEEEERDKCENRIEIENRVRTDCMYLWDLLCKFIAEFGLHLTQATAAMNAWVRISGEKKPETTREYYETIAPYYYGGRVECYTPGIVEKNFVIIDKNSAYPFAMLSNHPYGGLVSEQRTLPEGKAAIARSFVRLECTSRGAFPFRDSDNSLTFPDDRETRVFDVTGWEYLAAQDTNVLGQHRILSVLQCPLSINFRSYIDHFYQMKIDARKAGDVARYEFAKRFYNSVYGKFGANPAEYQEHKLIHPRFIAACAAQEDYGFCCELGPWALMARDLSEAKQRYYDVAVAASVAGFQRAEMQRARSQVQGLLYMDTDSLHCTSTGTLELDDSKIGAWKIEAQCKFGAYGGKKMYACEETDAYYKEQKKKDANHKKWKIASKGVRLGHEELIRIAKGEAFLYENEAPQYSVKNGINFVPRLVKRTDLDYDPAYLATVRSNRKTRKKETV